jgi:hypothetical protein
MLDADDIRKHQEQRLVPPLEAWNEAKEHLAKAIALAELREREYLAISEDVQRKLGALDVVIGMANEIEDVPESLPRLLPPKPEPVAETSLQAREGEPRTHGLVGLLHATSRPLFSPRQRSSNSILSLR